MANLYSENCAAVYLLLLNICPSLWTWTLDDENAWPRQFFATHEYVPREDESEEFALRANVSPAFIFLPSLYQCKIGVGTPITLHSKETVPSSDSIAFNSSTKRGALYALGTAKKLVKKEYYK